MLSKFDVFAVMVTYNPDRSVIDNVAALLNQVAEVLIIDNGSNVQTMGYLIEISKKERVSIIYNNNNKGIAYALNQGLAEAKSKNFKLFLTIDQDSTLHKNCIESMIKVMNDNDGLISVGPNYHNKGPIANDVYNEVDVLISSGNLTYTDLAVSSGGYTNKLFIDSVDFDFSLTLKQNGGKLARVYDARMDHKLGELIEVRISKLHFFLTMHSPLRHYYMYRNHYYIMKKFIYKYPKFCIKKELVMWKYFVEVIMLHPCKKENFQMILKGVKHAIQDKFEEYSD